MTTLNANARTDAAEVKNFTGTSIADDRVKELINEAAIHVDEIAGKDSTIGSERLRLIELNLASSGTTLTDPHKKREEHESYGASFDRESSYYQKAVRLDPTGTLDGGAFIDFGTPDSKGIR